MTYEREYVLPRILEEASLVDHQEGQEATLVDEDGQLSLLVRVLCARCARTRAGTAHAEQRAASCQAILRCPPPTRLERLSAMYVMGCLMVRVGRQRAGACKMP